MGVFTDTEFLFGKRKRKLLEAVIGYCCTVSQMHLLSLIYSFKMIKGANFVMRIIPQ